MIRTIAGWITILLLIPTPILAQVCLDHKRLEKALKEKYEEQLFWTGVSASGNIIKMYASKNTWTIVVVTPEISCLLDAGESPKWTELGEKV